MANDRMTRINELMRHEIANIVQKDFEFSDALVTINAVQISPDLRDGTVHVGIIGAEPRQQAALDSLERGRAEIQSQVSKRVKLRLTPRLHFKLDRSGERAADILSVLDEIAEEEKSRPPRGEDDRDDQTS